MGIRLTIAACIASLVCLCSCTGGSSQLPAVTVSILPQKYILDRIVGDKAEVKVMLAAGANPETYDPSVTNLMGLQNSMAYMKVGGIGFEDALVKKISATNPSLPVYDTSKGIKPIYGTHGHECHHVDPHVWTSVKNMRVMAANMLEAMKEVDASNAGYYQKNYDNLARQLERLDKEMEQTLAAHRGESFIVWHPSLSYLARDYGLKQIVIGGHENKEVSVPDLRRMIDSVKSDREMTFFLQKDFDNLQAASINNDLGARQVEISPMDYQWEEQMRLIGRELAK